MKILVIGCGVIGTILGNMLSKSNNDIYHYVRNKEKANKYQKGINLQMVDGRSKAKSKQYKSTYTPKIITELKNDKFELVVVSVNVHQLEGVLKEIKDELSGAIFLIVNNFWGEAAEFERYLPNEKYVWAFPAAGGGFNDIEGVPTIRGAIADPITIGSINNKNDAYISIINGLFTKAGLKTKMEKNMLHWLWSHYAFICGLNVACVSSGGNAAFLSKMDNMKTAALLTKETLAVCAARGVNIKEFSDQNAFMLPTPIISVLFWLILKMNKTSAKIILEYKGKDEIREMYDAMIKTAKEYNINMKKMIEYNPLMNKI